MHSTRRPQQLPTINNLIHSFPGAVWIKDLNLNYTHCNKHFLSLANLDEKDIIEQSDFQLPWADYSEEYRKSNKEVLSKGEQTLLNPIKTKSGEIKTIINRMARLENESQEVCGIISYVTLVSDKSLVQKLCKLRSVKLEYTGSIGPNKLYKLGCQNYDFNLTPAESKILFYILRGFSATMIASRLSRSSRTVETHIEKIKLKLDCDNKNDLINKAISLGYMAIIPENVDLNPFDGEWDN